MDRYPNPLDYTRGSFPRTVAEVSAAVGIGGIAALLVATQSVQAGAWLLYGTFLAVGLVVVSYDEVRLRRLDARAWTTDQWEDLRDREYRRRQGLFLTHTATPCESPPNADHLDPRWWSVTVRLIQHRSGPLSRGHVREVEYAFGPKFEEGPVKRQDPSDSFAYTTELYGPLMLLGRVHFKNPMSRPLLVERYIDLPSIGPGQ